MSIAQSACQLLILIVKYLLQIQSLSEKYQLIFDYRFNDFYYDFA